MPKIFGREPAVIVGLIEAFLALLISFGWLSVIGLRGQEELAIVMAVVSAAAGLYVAYVTKATLLGVAVGFIKALAALAAVYGLQISVEQTGALIAFVTVLLSMYQRTQTEPIASPNFDLTA